MSDLCERLQDVAEAGVYRLSCPLEVLRDNVLLSALCLFEADLANVHGKGEFLAAIADSLQAPDWFGHNFDALADALGDLSWAGEHGKGYVLLLRNGGTTLGLSEAEHANVMEIFNETASYWKTQDTPFWIFIA